VSEELSLRDTINAAYEAQEPAADDTPPADTPPPAETPPADTPPPAKETPPADTPPPAKETPPEPQQQELKFKAPGSWKPTMREKWASLPPEIQEEIVRRESEISRGLTTSAEARQLQERFSQAIKPYESMIAAGSGDPIQTVSNMMRTAAILQMGTPIEKAHAAANIIQQFGVDLRTLDSLLAGQAPAGGVDPQLQAYLQQQLSPIQKLAQQLTERERQSMSSMEETANSSIEAFAQDPKNEFFSDVRDTMADLMEVAAKRGQKMDLQSAYNRAIMMHEDIAKVVEDRRKAASAAEAKRAADEARRKGSSVRGAPAVHPQGTVPPTNSMREDIEAAISRLSE